MNIKSTLFTIGCLLTGAFPAHAADTYYMSGSVSGFMTYTDGSCYLSINDPTNSYYKNQWHKSTGATVCTMARIAYITQTPVSVGATVDTSGEPAATNNIYYIGSYNSDVTWPPYHDK